MFGFSVSGKLGEISASTDFVSNEVVRSCTGQPFVSDFDLEARALHRSAWRLLMEMAASTRHAPDRDGDA